jgi:hypothetical protein
VALAGGLRNDYRRPRSSSPAQRESFRSANSAAYTAIEETLKGECSICGIGVPLMKMRHAEDGARAGGDREAIRSP